MLCDVRTLPNDLPTPRLLAIASLRRHKYGGLVILSSPHIYDVGTDNMLSIMLPIKADQSCTPVSLDRPLEAMLSFINP